MSDSESSPPSEPPVQPKPAAPAAASPPGETPSGETPSGELKGSAYRGAAATAVQQGVRFAVQMISLVVLARILEPADFGVYAMVLPIAAIVGLFQDMGLQDAIIQRRDVTHTQVNALYWINVTMTGVIAAALLAASPLVGALYGDPRTATLTAALAVPILVGGLAHQQYAMLARDLRFMTLAVIDIACVATGFVVAVVCALLWQSYWALWASGVASALVWTVAATLASSWRPSWPSFRAQTDGMLRFGAHVTGVTVVNFLVENVDNILIGRSWGAVALGFYDRAYKLLLFPVQNVSRPLARVAIPLLSRMQDDPERLRRAYLRILGQVNLLTVPAIAAALAAHDELVRLFLGERWAPAAALFAWLGIAALHQPTSASIEWLLRVQDRTSELLRVTVIAGLVTVAAFFVGLPGGALGVAKAFVIADCCVRLPLMVWSAGRVGSVRRLDIVQSLAPLLVAAGGTWVAVELLLAAGVGGVVLLGGAVATSYALAMIAMLAAPMGRAILFETMAMIESMARRAAAIVRARLRPAG